MKPDLDESDADGPQDARTADFGAPEAARSLEQLFGPRVPVADSDEAAAAAAQARLAAFFAQRPQMAPASQPPAVEVPVARPAPAAVVSASSAPPKAQHGGTFGAGTPAASRRGIRGALFGSWWRSFISVAASVVLIAAIVAAAVIGTQLVADNARLAAAQRALDSAEAAVDSPAARLETSQAQYADAVATAQAATDEAGPALAAVAGMTDPAALDQANSALAAVTDGLAQGSPPPAPAPYERGGVDRSDIHAVTASEKRARDYVKSLAEAQAVVDAARNDLVTRTLALQAAEKTVGSGLPAVAAVLVADNKLAEQSFRDAVTAAAAAVVAAQAGGASGNPELVSYATAVDALRADQARAVAEKKNTTSPTRPRTTTPSTGTSSTPAPTPAPQPTPDPQPSPDPTP